MILLVDNYDSFVFNLERYFRRLGQTTLVLRNDRVSVADVERIAPTAIVFSPGPCAPEQAGAALELAAARIESIPMLGVCLGHQILAQALGASIVRAPQPMHGRTSAIRHDGRGVFTGLPSPLEVCRYHSLVVDAETLPPCAEPSAQTDDGVLMAFRHRELPVVGLQFHPEAILTRHGYAMLRQFLIDIGQPAPAEIDDEWRRPAREPQLEPYMEPASNRPITF